MQNSLYSVVAHLALFPSSFTEDYHDRTRFSLISCFCWCLTNNTNLLLVSLVFQETDTSMLLVSWCLRIIHKIQFYNIYQLCENSRLWRIGEGGSFVADTSGCSFLLSLAARNGRCGRDIQINIDLSSVSLSETASHHSRNIREPISFCLASFDSRTHFHRPLDWFHLFQ